MQRNWDVIRRILLQVEALPTLDSDVGSDQIAGVGSEVAAYHMRLLIEAGMIEGGCRRGMGPAYCHATALTWAGHEFLDQVRRDPVWNRIKILARDKGVELSFDVIVMAAKAVIKDLIG